ncbi:mfs-type transporter [Fusarium langsethiae]|uniref:Mfs-type transporter n=1 Tax=Fusarium langsethiae TaxID=179993 RepID=A0A0M9F2P2_FUSLA|nr:mfs-type transporter [Fusarium langsethiae]
MRLFRWTQRDEPPVLLKVRSSAGLIVTTCSFAIFTDIFLYGVIVPILPFSFEERVGISPDRVQYWVSIALAVFGAALLAGSRLVVLCGATVFLCVGRTLALFMVGRALQGISAALTWTVGLALVVDTVDKEHIGKAMGWISTACSLGILVAPLLGGVVYGKGGYYSVFAMCFGLLAVDIALRLAIIEVKDAKVWLDRAGTTSSADPESAVEGTIVSTTDKTGDAPVRTTQDQSKEVSDSSRSPIKTLVKLLKQPQFLAALWGTFVQALINTALESTLPLLTHEIFGWDSIGAGLIFLPLILPSFLGPVVGMICDRYGPKWIASFGFLFATPFVVCMMFVDENTIQDKILLCGLLAGVGITMACIFGPLMAEITWAVQGEDGTGGAGQIAQAYGLYNMAYSGGSLVGPIMGGMVKDSSGWGTLQQYPSIFKLPFSINNHLPLLILINKKLKREYGEKVCSPLENPNLTPSLPNSIPSFPETRGKTFSIMEQQHIDELLERYLGLLDEYTQLRQTLSQLQSGVYQNIARANFSGERGMRYGHDHYDERMQAIRLLSISQNEHQSPIFSILNVPEEEEEEEEEKGEEQDESSATEGHKQGPKPETGEEKPAEKKRKNKNPLHWFGLFVPMGLRTAQTQSIKTVEDIIPRLVSVNAEMLDVEIEVRRARKRRAKAEMAEKKTGQATTDTQSQIPTLEAS